MNEKRLCLCDKDCNHCAAIHNRQVINGNRQSKHLMARLAKAGVKVEVA